MSANIHISLSAEPIYYIGSFPITNAMFTSLIISAGIILFAVLANRSLKSTDKPTGLQNVAEFIVESFFHFCHSITGDMKKAQVFLPWVATFFIFIMLNNWSGLIPGVGYIFVPVAHKSETSAVQLIPMVNASEVTTAETPTELTAEPGAEAGAAQAEQHEGIEAIAGEAGTEVHAETAGESAEGTSSHSGPAMTPIFRAGTADLNTTLALGLISVFMVQFFGFQFQGFAYLLKYFNFSSPINFFVGILELISEFGKIISFGFRLFGNIFAGEVLIGVLMYLTKVIVPVPFYGLELFVGMMQAVVFSMLSLVLFNMATIGHHEEH